MGLHGSALSCQHSPYLTLEKIAENTRLQAISFDGTDFVDDKLLVSLSCLQSLCQLKLANLEPQLAFTVARLDNR
jgi:hypothetical protein